jgi:hypothetical protein
MKPQVFGECEVELKFFCVLENLAQMGCGGINPYTLTARHGQTQTRRPDPLHDDARSRSSGWILTQGIKPDLGIKQGLGQLD